MAETFSKNDLFSAQTNFKKLLEVALSTEINTDQPLDDPKILQKIQEMTNAINDPINTCYPVPRLFRDCSEGNYDGVKEHIKNRCDVNEIGPDGETPLTCAINANNYNIVELLLKSGADPNLRPDKVESTPLMDAANVGYKDIVQILLEYGANPDIKSSTNNTALHYAACSGHSECCKLLLDYSSNRQALLEEQNENGHTALMEASTGGFLETTKFFVKNGAQINTPSAEFKETALTLASYKGYSDIVQFLLEAGADHEHRTDEMHTALMEASMEGHIEAARVLLNYGAQVNMRADSFESPLTLAACSGHTDLAGYLIKYGADIEEVNDESYTPLMEASREGHLETVVMLLALGAKINRVTEETQETAMTLAACGGFYDIVMLLHRCGGDIEKGASTPLMESSQEGHLDIVKSLICMGANIEAKNASDETSLHFAAENGHLEVVLYLLDCNANIHHTSEGGRTALMKASRAGNLNVVILLVERGACVDQLTLQGDHNALSLACANGHCKVVEYLLKVGADPTIKLKDNCTVLIEASRAGHSDVIETLLKENKRNKKIGGVHSPSNPHSCPNNSALSNIELDLNEVQHFSSQYISMGDHDTNLNTVTSQNNCNINKILNSPMGMKINHSISNSSCSHTSQNIQFNDSNLSSNAQSLQNLSQFHPCSFTHSIVNDKEIQSKSCFNIQMINDALSNDITSDHTKYIRPLFLSNEIPDPPSNPPPMPSFPNCTNNQVFIESNNTLLSLNDDANLSMTLMGIENQKLLQNILDPNSPNLEEWVKYICPNFNNNLYSNEPNYETLSKLTLLQSESNSSELPQLLQQTNNVQFHRKIKKAKHSDSYSLHNDSCRNCPYSYQQRLSTPLSPEKSIAFESNFGVYRCPGEGVDCDGESAPKNKTYHKDIIFTDQFNNNKVNNDLGSTCNDCTTPQNIFSANSNKPFNSNISPTGTCGIFSVEKVNDDIIYAPKSDVPIVNRLQTFSNGSTLPSYSQDDSYSDVKRMFNSVTPTSVSPIKSKTNSMTLTMPFQKQVLQPKRRLQQNQRSPLSNMSQMSNTSNVCHDNKISHLKSISQNDQFILSSAPVNQNIFDSLSFSAQESNNSFNTNFTFPEKSYSNDERVEFYQQTMLSDLPNTNNMLSSHMCQLSQDCGSKLISPSYHLDFMPKLSSDNCDISNRKPSMAISNNNSIENLEVVEEIENEENDDDDDFESEIEIDHCNVPSYNSNSINHVNCLKHNSKKKLNVNVCTESLQESPLSLACSGGHIEVVKLLINSGAKLEHRDKKSQTALHVAVLNGHLEVVKFLLDSGSDIESMVERTKDTALSIACANGKYDIVEELVKRNAMIEHRNISDYTPLSLAASGGFVDIIKFLLKNNAEINSRTNSKLGISPLMLAAMNGHVNAVNVLLESGSDINAQIETNRNTALTLACFQGRNEVVSLLVDKKAYVEHRAKSGLTPLMEAASQGHVEVGRILINAGADVNAAPVPSSRETVLIIAADKGHTEFVKLLLKNGAIVDARNKKGDTPLWLACNGGYIDVVKLLIEYKADVNSSDNRRMTCLMTAFKKGHIKVVKELVKFVTQFPSEHDCNKHLKSIKDGDKDIVNRCEACKEIILKAKERQEYEAAKNAKDLLKQVEEERKAKEQKEVKQAKKREKKKAKKKAKQEKDDIPKSDIKDTSDDNLLLPQIQHGYIVSYYLEDLDQKISINNNENINPDNRTCMKSNKQSKIKSESDKSKSTNSTDDLKSKKLMNGVISKVKKEEPVNIVKESYGKFILNSSNIMEVSPNKSNTKGSTWTQINSNKNVQSNKTEETLNSNWQKIGGNKKKLDIQVNKKDIGKVIGQGGSVVNAIRHITGAHIDIDSMANELDERTVHLKGTSEAVHKAKEYICDLVEGKITGNYVIQESETFVAKSVNNQKVTSEFSNISNSSEVEFSKAAHPKSLSLVRHNGKINKIGYNKFSLTPVNNSNNNNSLQYGFSKSVKGPDFATVAAAGIVTVNSSVHLPQRSKYSEKITYTGNYHNTHFPSLSEVNSDSFVTNQSFDTGGKISDSPLIENQTHFIHEKHLETETSLISEPLEVNTNMQVMTGLSSFVPTNVSKSFPLAPGSERSLHQRTYNSTPEHSPQIENCSKTNNKNNGSSSAEMNSSDSTITSNNSDKDDMGDFNNLNVNNSCIPGPRSSMVNISNWTTISQNEKQFVDFNKSYQDSNINLINSDQTTLNDYEVMSHYPKLQSLNPKAEAFSPAVGSISNTNYYGYKPEDLFYTINGTLSLNPSAHIFKPRLGIPVHGMGNVGPNIQQMSSNNVYNNSNNSISNNSNNNNNNNNSNNTANNNVQQKTSSKYDHSGSNNPTLNKNVKNSSVYSMHQVVNITNTSSVPSVTAHHYSTKNHNSFVVPQEERVIRLQDHINKAINILISTTNCDQSMAEAAFSSFMRSANLDLNSPLSSSEFTVLINNIMNQSTNPQPQAPIINNNLSQPISFLPAANNGINYSNHIADMGNSENLNRVLPAQPPIPLRHQPILLNQIPPTPQAGLATPSAQTAWPILNNVPLSNFNSIWAAPGSNNTLAPLNSPYFSTIGHCVSAQTAFNSALSYNLQQSSSLSTSNSNESSISFGCDNNNPVSTTTNTSKNAISSQKLLDSNVKVGIITTTPASTTINVNDTNGSIPMHDSEFDKKEL